MIIIGEDEWQSRRVQVKRLRERAGNREEWGRVGGREGERSVLIEMESCI